MWLKLAVVAATLLLLWVVVFLYYLPRTENGVRHFYTKQLGKLNGSVTAINSEINAPIDPKTTLINYDKLLNKTLPLCQKMEQRYHQIEHKRYKKEVRDAVQGAHQLCTDLTSIISYSKDLYGTLSPYILYDTENWPAFESNEFTGHLASTQGMLRTALPRLEKLSYPNIDDPALGEFITQVKSADKLAEDTYTVASKNDAQQAQELSEKLRKEMTRDKAGFINARLYFWNNTVQVNVLQQVISRLAEQLKP